MYFRKIYILIRHDLCMKRKIVKHGESTLTISLPSKWVKTNNIKQGQYLNLEPSKEKIIISFGTKHFEAIDIKLSEQEEGWAIGKIMRHLYISGYDEINIHFSKQYQLAEIRKGLIVLTGMEIIESKPNRCKLRCVISIDEAEYGSIIKRMLNLVSSQLEYFIEDCKAKKNSMSNEAKEIFFTFSKLCNLSRRLVNKNNIYDSIQSKYAYDFLNGLMEISLFVKYSYEEINKPEKINLNEDEIRFMDKVNLFFSELLLAYNTLNLERTKSFFIEREDIFYEVLDLLKGNNPIIMHYFLIILRNMTSIGNHILMLKIDNENEKS